MFYTASSVDRSQSAEYTLIIVCTDNIKYYKQFSFLSHVSKSYLTIFSKNVTTFWETIFLEKNCNI